MKDKLLRYLPYIASGLLIIGLGSLYAFSQEFRQIIQEGWSLFKQGDRQAIAEWFQSFGAWGPFVILLFMLLQMILAVIPSWLMMIVSILGYGPIWGSLLCIGGILLAAVVAYWIGRGLGEGFISRFIGKKTEKKMDKWLENYGLGAVAIFRLSPFLSNDAISFVAGMLDMKFWRFVLGTLLGITPLTIAIALFSDSTDTLKTGMIWIAAGGILLYGVYIWLDRKSNK